MKSVIVIYTPIIDGVTQSKSLKQDLDDIKTNSELSDDFHLIIIQEPDRKNIKTEVFFKPE